MRVFGCVVAAWTLVVTGWAPRAAPSPQPASEVRALWVLRTSLTTQASITEMIRLADVGGFNTIFVQVRGRGDAYYTSAIEPRAADIREDASFDPLAETLRQARAAGLKVHAWFNVNLVASAATLPADARHVIRRHPEWLMLPEALAATQGRRDPRSAAFVTALAGWTRPRSGTVEGLFLSPIPDEAQAYTVGVVRDLLSRYTLDGLHLDYIRYPSPDFDVSLAARQAFRDHLVADLAPAEVQQLETLGRTDPLVWMRRYPERWHAFRRERLTALVRRIAAEVRARPGVALSAAVLPDPADARDRKLQDWSRWLSDGLLDAISPMAYAEDLPAFETQITQALDGAGGRPVWAGIGAWRLPVSRTAAAIRLSRSRGAAGFALFSYDGLLTVGARRGSAFLQLRPTVSPELP